MAETVMPKRCGRRRGRWRRCGAGGDQQSQVREAFEHLGREPGAFAHRDEHVEARQGRDDRVAPGEGLGEDGDLAGQAGPVGQFRGDALVVVEDRDAGVVGHPDTSHETAACGKPARRWRRVRRSWDSGTIRPEARSTEGASAPWRPRFSHRDMPRPREGRSDEHRHPDPPRRRHGHEPRPHPRARPRRWRRRRRGLRRSVRHAAATCASSRRSSSSRLPPAAA